MKTFLSNSFEVELSFWHGEGSDDRTLVVPFEANCPTEVSAKAYETARLNGATSYTFGPRVERRVDGSIDYPKLQAKKR